MWNQSSGASIGALLQNLAQTNPRVLQQIMQIMQQRQQQGVGGIGSLPQPGAGGPMPMGGLWGMTGQQPTSPLPYGQRFNMNPGPSHPAIPMPTVTGPRSAVPVGTIGGTTLDSYPRMGGSSPSAPSASAWSGSGIRGFQGTGPTQPSYTMPTGPKSYGTPEPYTAPTGPKYMPPTGPKAWGTPQPYAAPTGPKYMPPTGPKVYGQTMPAEQPPAFTAPSQPKVYNPMPVVGDGTTGLDWYAQQAGN
jgi:hypothetical protein